MTTEQTRNQIKGLTSIGFAASFGSAFGVLTRTVEHYGPFGVLALRGIWQVTTLLLVALIRHERPRLICRDLFVTDRLGVLATLGMAGQSFGITVAMLMTTVSNVFFCVNTAPAFCMLADALILKEAVPWRTRIMVGLCLAGILIILVGSYESGGSFWGCLVALINPISWATYWCTQRHRSKQSKAKVQAELPFVLVRAQLVLILFGAVGSGFSGSVANGVSYAHEHGSILRDIILFAFFGGFYLPICQVFFSLAPRYIPTAEVACVKVIETILGPIWIYLFQREVPSFYTIVGGTIIFVAIVCHSLAVLLESDGSAVNDVNEAGGAAPDLDDSRVGATEHVCLENLATSEGANVVPESASLGAVKSLCSDGLARQVAPNFGGDNIDVPSKEPSILVSL